MGKPTICIGENKDADQLRGYVSAFVSANRIGQFLLYLNPKFQASSSFLCLYRSVCVGPVRKPHCWFSHEVAHMWPHVTYMCTQSPTNWLQLSFLFLSMKAQTNFLRCIGYLNFTKDRTKLDLLTVYETSN